MKAHRVRSVSAFNFVNFLNFFNSQEYFAEMGFHGFGLYRFESAVLSDKKKASRGVLLAICKAGKGREEMQGEPYTMGREMPLIF